MSKRPYKMTISRLTVDKLGVKLYDRVSAVIAELIANCYDADSTRVEVVAPMDELLATKSGVTTTDKGFSIEVTDDGCGMTPEEVNAFYLVVGAERRNDPRRGDTSSKFHRKVMGRKGVGKLAPFGVCKNLEIISSGGSRIDGTDEHGAAAKGYLTSHLILRRDQILTDTDADYYPDVGTSDGIVRKKHGTTLRLTGFDHRRVPALDSLERQLSQRFGVTSTDWQITLTDSLKTFVISRRSKKSPKSLPARTRRTDAKKGENWLGLFGGNKSAPVERTADNCLFQDKTNECHDRRGTAGDWIRCRSLYRRSSVHSVGPSQNHSIQDSPCRISSQCVSPPSSPAQESASAPSARSPPPS